jgi:hypothetical protein
MPTSRPFLSYLPAHSCPALFCSLLHQSEAHLLIFQSFLHSIQKHPGVTQSVFQLFNFELFNLRSSNSFIRNTYSRSPRFAVFWPKSSARNPFRCNTYRSPRRNPFIRNTYKKQGRGPRHLLLSSDLPSRPACAANFARLQQGGVIYSRRIDLLSAGVAPG